MFHAPHIRHNTSSLSETKPKLYNEKKTFRFSYCSVSSSDWLKQKKV